MQNLIKEAIRSIRPEWVKEAIQKDLDLVPLIFNHYHLSDPKVKPMARLVLQKFWADLEKYLTNANEILKAFSDNKEIVKILASEEGIIWLNKQVTKLYDAFYYYVWYGKDPVMTYAKPQNT